LQDCVLDRRDDPPSNELASAFEIGEHGAHGDLIAASCRDGPSHLAYTVEAIDLPRFRFVQPTNPTKDLIQGSTR